MKRIVIALCLCATSAGMLHAQNYLLEGATSSPVSSTAIYDDGVNISIGSGAPGATLDVLNQQYNPFGLSNTPTFRLQRQMMVTTGPGPTGTYLTNLTDFVVYPPGLMGIGVDPPQAHLDILPASADGMPLLQVTANSSVTPSLYIDQDGLVCVGSNAPTGYFAMEVQGQFGVLGNSAYFGDAMFTDQVVIGGDGGYVGSIDLQAQHLPSGSYAQKIRISDAATRALTVQQYVSGSAAQDKFIVYGDGRTVIKNMDSNIHLYRHPVQFFPRYTGTMYSNIFGFICSGATDYVFHVYGGNGQQDINISGTIAPDRLDTARVLIDNSIWDGLLCDQSYACFLSLSNCGYTQKFEFDVQPMCSDDPEGKTSFDKIDSTNFNVEVGLYPNPVNEIVTLNIKASQALQDIDIKIFDTYGKLVKDNLSFNTSEINLSKQITMSDMADGVYQIQVSVLGKYYFKKIIKVGL